MKLDRKVLIFKVIESGKVGYNYQFKFMQQLYRIMSKTNSEKTKFLHDIGHKVDNKTFKLFNWHIFFEGADYKKDSINLTKDGCVKMTISGETNILNLIGKSLMMNEINIESVKLKFVGVNADKRIRYQNIMLYKVRNPIVESIYDTNRKKCVYLDLFTEEYFSALGNNLKRKYKAIYDKEYTGELYFDIEDPFKAKKKFIKDVNKDGYTIGYSDFEIYIQAEKEIQEIAYKLGLGQNNSMGMGQLSYICGRNE